MSAPEKKFLQALQKHITATAAMAPSTQNSAFIKQLASSERQIREKALESLRLFLQGRAQLDELELLKLWKGLFYCMWMSDKPKAQQQLAIELGTLVDSLHENMAIPFVQAFWTTMAREWAGIDVLRMNKFLFLVRQYLAASFRFFAKRKWANTKALDNYLAFLSTVPLNIPDPKIPNGMRYHVLDIYVDELNKVDADRNGIMPLETLLEPVRKLLKESKTKAVRERAKETLDDERLENWDGSKDADTKSESADAQMDDAEDDEWGGIDD